MDSFPKYHLNSPADHVAASTKHCNYHGIDIEIKGNHPLADGYDYALKIYGTGEKSDTQIAELAQIPNPSPTAKGWNYKK